MKYRWLLFLFFSFALVFNSCVIEKRHYRNGFYIDWSRNHSKELTREELPPIDSMEEVVLMKESDPVCEAVVLAPANENLPREKSSEVTSTRCADGESTSPARTATVDLPDEPKPEQHDKINPKLIMLVIAGMICSLAFVLAPLISASAGLYFYVLAPLLGVALFALAMYLRSKYQLRVAAGEKSESLRMSAHFHRFRVLLYLFFIASLVMGIAFGIAGGTADGIAAGLVGVIFGGGGAILVQGVGIVLLVLGILYLIFWRKDPTGYKPPRDPHPPKDR